MGLVPYQGLVLLGGDRLDRLSPRLRARRVAYVPQQSGLDAALAVEQVVAQGRIPHRPVLGRPSAADRAAIQDALEKTDTHGFVGRLFCHLSHGERRRVLIARALATEAPLLVLDEPTAALDVRHVLELFDLLRRLRAHGLGIWIVLHQLQEVTEIATRAILLCRGRIACEGPVDQVIAPGPVLQVYGVELTRGPGLRYAPANTRR
jgi:iron complex transport system ATP-binding protein